VLSLSMSMRNTIAVCEDPGRPYLLVRVAARAPEALVARVHLDMLGIHPDRKLGPQRRPRDRGVVQDRLAAVPVARAIIQHGCWEYDTFNSGKHCRGGARLVAKATYFAGLEVLAARQASAGRAHRRTRAPGALSILAATNKLDSSKPLLH
jgi:hypothetical protein